jgi:hypothetical protein
MPPERSHVTFSKNLPLKGGLPSRGRDSGNTVAPTPVAASLPLGARAGRASPRPPRATPAGHRPAPRSGGPTPPVGSPLSESARLLRAARRAHPTRLARAAGPRGRCPRGAGRGPAAGRPAHLPRNPAAGSPPGHGWKRCAASPAAGSIPGVCRPRGTYRAAALQRHGPASVPENRVKGCRCTQERARRGSRPIANPCSGGLPDRPVSDGWGAAPKQYPQARGTRPFPPDRESTGLKYLRLREREGNGKLFF